jgi:hypothetical protein
MKLKPRVPYRETSPLNHNPTPGTRSLRPPITFFVWVEPLVIPYEIHDHTVELVGVFELSPVTTPVEKQ